MARKEIINRSKLFDLCKASCDKCVHQNVKRPFKDVGTRISVIYLKADFNYFMLPLWNNLNRPVGWQ